MSQHKHTKATVAALEVLFLFLLPNVSSAQEVTLPLEDYESLRKRAAPQPTASPRPEIAFTLDEAVLEIHAGRESARVTERLALSIYDEGWQSIGLAEIGSLTSVEMGTLEGRVSLDGGRRLRVRGRGRYEVILESVVGIVESSTSARPTRKLCFELPRAGMVGGFIESDGDLEEILLVGGALPRGPLAGRRLELVGDPGQMLEATLLSERGVTDRASLPLKFEAASSTVTFVERTRFDTKAFINAEVVQGELETLGLTVPRGLEVVGVEPDTLGWDMESDGTLILHPPAPVSTGLSATVLLSGAARLSFDSPLLVPQGAIRLALLTGLRMEADGIPLLLEPGAARPAETNDLDALPESVKQTLARAFVVRDPQRPPRWSIEWSDASQQPVLATQVDRLVVDVLVGDVGSAGYQSWFDVRTNGSMNVTIHPPPGFELSRATRDGLRVTPGVSGAGLAIPLAASREVQTIHVEGIVPLEAPLAKGDFKIPLPGFSVPVGGIEVRAVLPGDRQFEMARRFDRATSSLPSDIFSVPLGYSVHRARWSALTATPEPLFFRVESKRAKRRWF